MTVTSIREATITTIQQSALRWQQGGGRQRVQWRQERWRRRKGLRASDGDGAEEGGGGGNEGGG